MQVASIGPVLFWAGRNWVRFSNLLSVQSISLAASFTPAIGAIMAPHGKLKCPKCRNNGVRRSPRKSAMEYVLSLAYVYPFRCEFCGQRFKRIQWGRRYRVKDMPAG
jgi:hypothetical protein